MKKQDFQFDLPGELIAQTPCENRSASRLLCVDGVSGQRSHHHFYDLPDLLNPGDLLVLNDTRVIPARTYAIRPTGGVVEVMVERILDSETISAHLKASNTPKPGLNMTLAEGSVITIDKREGDLFILTLQDQTKKWDDILHRVGTMPLPPYIERKSKDIDFERYQTVYADEPGSVAAPTAGLHFDESVFQQLDEKGIERGFVTLHVGAGTFQPVRVDDVKDHIMHSERIRVTETLCDQVMETKKRGGRVVAVGTTSVRCLETAWQEGGLKPYEGETDIFMTPGYEFQCVDALITNFHLPESTLLMLVSAFVGTDLIKETYAEAVEKKYRFFSYGDAMFLER